MASGSIDRVGIDQGLVALDVDDDRAGERARHLGESIRAGRVVRARHDGDAAEAIDRLGDPVIVGRDDDGVDGGRHRHAVVDVFDHGPAVDEREGFSWKPGRLVSRRDHRDDSSRADWRCEPCGENDGHGEW
jgi:hypothetical protein